MQFRQVIRMAVLVTYIYVCMYVCIYEAASVFRRICHLLRSRLPANKGSEIHHRVKLTKLSLPPLINYEKELFPKQLATYRMAIYFRGGKFSRIECHS